MSTLKTAKGYISGILLTVCLGILSFCTNEVTKHVLPLEAVTIAIFIGIATSNVFHLPKALNKGFKFCSNYLLQWGIVLLGFKLSFNAVLGLGYKTLIIIACLVPSVVFGGYIIGRIFKVGNNISKLLGIGSGICGASAVVAMGPVLRAREDETVVAVTVINFLGAIGVLIYSLVASLHLISIEQYGVWSGLSLQGVAHALAAAFAGGDRAGELGTIVKMGRVLMLVPIAIFFSLRSKQPGENSPRVPFPYYVLFFVISGIINSLGIIPVSITHVLDKVSGWLILLAMTAMGLTVQFSSVKQSGGKALLAGGVLFLIVSLITLIMALLIY